MSVFQKIIDKEIAADIIYEDKDAMAFYDNNPRSPGHFLVIPKKHSNNLIDISSDELTKLIIVARDLAIKEIQKRNVSGFQLLINNGAEAGQEIFHTHIHIIPANKL